MQYGLSARELAIDTAMSHPEEFSKCVRFWLEQLADNSQSMGVYAKIGTPRN